MKEFGLLFIGLGLFMSNLFFWAHMCIEENWKMGFCLFMALGFPLLLLGLVLLLV